MSATASNRDSTVAVDPEYFWRPMKDCPRGLKVQLLNAGGVAVYGTHDGKVNCWRGWAPLPKIRKATTVAHRDTT